jgi:Uma2 family endonuclease
MPIAEKYRPHYTYDDYCQWEGQWELIEGMPYAMCPAPVPLHQVIGGNCYALFKQGLKKGCNKCKAYPPVDWKIAQDTIVQPDMLIACGKIEKKYLDFPPILIVEILSASTAAKDRGEKMELYQSQQVKYYLIIDPQFKKTEVYQLIEGQYQPVSINPETFAFNLQDDCTAEVNLLDIWE